MPDDLDPRAGGEYANEMIVAELEAYDTHLIFLEKNILQSGYTMGNVPVPPDTTPTRELQLQIQAQDRSQPIQARTQALREILSMRSLNGNA